LKEAQLDEEGLRSLKKTVKRFAEALNHCGSGSASK
jgi:hypothetical protein